MEVNGWKNLEEVQGRKIDQNILYEKKKKPFSIKKKKKRTKQRVN